MRVYEYAGFRGRLLAALALLTCVLLLPPERMYCLGNSQTQMKVDGPNPHVPQVIPAASTIETRTEPRVPRTKLSAWAGEDAQECPAWVVDEINKNEFWASLRRVRVLCRPTHMMGRDGFSFIRADDLPPGAPAGLNGTAPQGAESRGRRTDRPKEAAAPGGSGSTSSDLLDSLDREMITDAIAKVMPRVQVCGDKSSAKGRVRVSVKVSPDGSVSGVTVRNTPDPGLGNCVAAVMQIAKFAKTQRGGSFAYPFW